MGFGLGLSPDNVITLLAPGGVAESTGQLQVGDKVTGVNGTFLDAKTTLSSVVGQLPVGSRVVINVQRGGSIAQNARAAIVETRCVVLEKIEVFFCTLAPLVSNGGVRKRGGQTLRSLY